MVENQGLEVKVFGKVGRSYPRPQENVLVVGDHMPFRDRRHLDADPLSGGVGDLMEILESKYAVERIHLLKRKKVPQRHINRLHPGDAYVDLLVLVLANRFELKRIRKVRYMVDLFEEAGLILDPSEIDSDSEEVKPYVPKLVFCRPEYEGFVENTLYPELIVPILIGKKAEDEETPLMSDGEVIRDILSLAARVIQEGRTVRAIKPTVFEKNSKPYKDGKECPYVEIRGVVRYCSMPTLGCEKWSPARKCNYEGPATFRLPKK